METHVALEGLEVGRPVEIGAADLATLLATCRTVREERPALAGPIRVLQCGDVVVLQEESPRGELFVRRLESRADAEALLADRLAVYERMWDGCGCKVHYRE